MAAVLNFISWGTFYGLVFGAGYIFNSVIHNPHD